MSKLSSSDVAAWVGAVTGVLALTVGIIQFVEAKREIVSVELSRLDYDFETELSRDVKARYRGFPQWSVAVYWELVISNRSSVPVSIVKADLEDKSIELLGPGLSSDGFYSSSLQRLEFPWNIEAHSGRSLLVRTLVGVERSLATRLTGDDVLAEAEIPVESLSDLAWDCHLAGADFFGNRVARPWGQPTLSIVERNPIVGIAITTAKGSTVSATASWYEERSPQSLGTKTSPLFARRPWSNWNHQNGRRRTLGSRGRLTPPLSRSPICGEGQR